MFGRERRFMFEETTESTENGRKNVPLGLCP